MPLRRSGFEGYSSKLLSAGSRPWDKGGARSSRPLDKWGHPVSKKIFSALWASVCSKIKGGGGGGGGGGASPGSATASMDTSLTCFPEKNPNRIWTNPADDLCETRKKRDEESRVPITRCPEWQVSKGRVRKGEGERDPSLSLSHFSSPLLPLPLFCACHAGYLVTPQGFIH